VLAISVRRLESGALVSNSGRPIEDMLFKAVGKALRAEAPGIQDDLRRHVGSQLAVKRKGFLKGFRAKVLDQDPSRPPGMVIGSRIPWSGVHQEGVTISGKMLIPLNGRVGRKRFKAYVTELLRGGNAYFVKKHGKVLLMAENIKEHDKPLAGFKRRYRKAEGISRLKRGADIPIAVLVPRVVIPRRLDVRGVVSRRIPEVIARISQEILKIA
jgi:uncharacterized protein DUF6441